MAQLKRRPNETDFDYDLRCIIAEDQRVRHEQANCDRIIKFFDVMKRGGDREKHHYVPQLARLNTLATDDLTKEGFRLLRRWTNRFFDRVLMAELNDAEMRVWRFVADRTFGWHKIAEKIPHDRMLRGYRDEQAEGGFQMGDDFPWSKGCGVNSPKAVVSALESLERRGLLGRLDGRENRHPVTFLAPLPVDFIIAFLVGCALSVGDGKVLSSYGQSRMIDLGDRLWRPWRESQEKRRLSQEKRRPADAAGWTMWQQGQGSLVPLVALAQSTLDVFTEADARLSSPAVPEGGLREAA